MLDSFYEKLKKPFTEGSVNIVCIGDSVTQGCFESTGGMHDSFRVFDSYTVKLHRELSFYFPQCIFNVINSGIGGDYAYGASQRFERDVLAYHPDLVIISFGVNDFTDPALHLSSMGKMFDILNEKGIPCVYMTEHMMNTRPCECANKGLVDYSHTTAKAQTDGTMDKLFDDCIAIAREKNITVCDIYHKWKRLGELGVDTTALLANGINHPVPRMHDFFAKCLVDTIFFGE